MRKSFNSEVWTDGEACWEVVLNEGSSMFPEGVTTHGDAVVCVQMILDQLRDGRYIVGVKPCKALERN